jgi:hypothetical protein
VWQKEAQETKTPEIPIKTKMMADMSKYLRILEGVRAASSLFSVG